MNINILNERKEGMEAALKYFWYYLDKDLSVENDYYSSRIFDDYLQKLKEKQSLYFKEEGEEELRNLTKGFLYVSEGLKSDKFKPYYVITSTFYRPYDNLIKEIGNYSFNSKWDNSYGFNQTRANEEILINILFLKPVIIATMKNIDKLLEYHTNIILQRKQSDVTKRIRVLSETLNEIQDELQTSRKKYHEIWKLNASRYPRHVYIEERTKANLGRAKKIWRLNKNKACCAILNFYKEMKELNKELCDLRPEMFEDLNNLYQYGIDAIMKSPNYYSYLSQEEIKKESSENKAKKLAMKKN